MPRPGEDRSDVGGAAQFTNIGPRTCPAFLVPAGYPPLPSFLARGQTEFQVNLKLGLTLGDTPSGRSQSLRCLVVRVVDENETGVTDSLTSDKGR